MGYWGKVIGGMAGFAFGGPFGAVMGAALGHAAETGGFGHIGQFRLGASPAGAFGPARLAALIGRKDQLFAIGVVVLSAKLAKVDGPVVRAEIDAFKRSFRIPPESARDIGRLFDQARDSSDGFTDYANQLGAAFADNRGMLEEVLFSLFAIARADKPINLREQEFLQGVAKGFGLDEGAWRRATGEAPRRPTNEVDEGDPYLILGASQKSTNDELRAKWKQLMRENHPDSLASRGVPADFIERASEKVARINAAWDRIKRDRKL